MTHWMFVQAFTPDAKNLSKQSLRQLDTPATPWDAKSPITSTAAVKNLFELIGKLLFRWKSPKTTGTLYTSRTGPVKLQKR